MRAVVVPAVGATPTLTDRELPTPDDGEVVVEMEAASLNPVDLAIASGNFYAGHPAPPYVPCIEAVGKVGGRRVFAMGGGVGVSRDGTASERFVIPEAVLIDVPDDADAATCAALGTAGLAGWLPVTWKAAVQPDEAVLVLGATGAAGTVAVQAARLSGASFVVAAGRNPAKLAEVGALADATVSLDTDDQASALRSVLPDGADVVFDALWGEPLAAALTVTNPGGRVVHVGQSAGPVSSVSSALVRGRQLTIMGYSNFGVPRDVIVDAYLTMVGLAGTGELLVPLRAVSLADVAEAWIGAAESAAKYVLVP